MTTIHDEAREVCKRLARRYNSSKDELDKLAYNTMIKAIKLIPERKAGGLHPNHVTLIKGLTPNFDPNVKRPEGETKAWKKIEAHVTATGAETVRMFMRLPKPKAKANGDSYDDHLSKRPKSAQRLINVYADILATADDYFRLHPSKGRGRNSTASNTPSAPADWVDRVAGGWKQLSWVEFCRKYPFESGQVFRGEDLTIGFEECTAEDLEAAFRAVGIDLKHPTKWQSEEATASRLRKNEDKHALEVGRSQLESRTGQAVTKGI